MALIYAVTPHLFPRVLVNCGIAGQRSARAIHLEGTRLYSKHAAGHRNFCRLFRRYVVMALRSLGRVGVDVGGRVAGMGKKTQPSITRNLVGGAAERRASSWVGHGHFGRSRAPSQRPGWSCASTQLFKLEETDLVMKGFNLYETYEAKSLGLFSIDEVLADISEATEVVPNRVATETASKSEESQAGVTAPGVREAEVLAAWGQKARLVEVPSIAEPVEVAAPTAGGEEVVGLEGDLAKLAIKRTYQPSTLKRKRMHGFLYRSKSRLGKKILKRRQQKGRTRLGI